MARDVTRDLPDTSNRAIGERLASIRQARGWSQAYAAQLIGVSPQRWGNWERGLNAPPPDLLGKLWQLTGATSDYLLFGRLDGMPFELAQAVSRPSVTAKSGTTGR
jgi:transcriptional regulator with XRE-family HTH domain